MSAIAFASLLLILMLSFQFGAYDTMINSSVKLHTGHLQVQAKGYRKKRKIDWVVSDPAAVGAILDATPGVSAYTFRCNAFSLVSTGERTYPSEVIGVDPEREARVSTLKDLIRHGKFLAEGDINVAVIGEILANHLKVGLGDELTILGQGRYGSIAATVVDIKGIYRSGQDKFDRSSILIPMNHFQDVYFMRGAVHEVVADVESLGRLPEVKKAVQAGLQKMTQKYPLVVLDWKELLPGLYQAIQIDLSSGVILYFILIIVIAFSILNTFLMTIFERTREFGVLMAIGITPKRLTKLLLMESTSMAILGVAAGILLGILTTGCFQLIGIDISGASELLNEFGISGRMYPRLSLFTVISGPMMVLLITFLAALYPAFRVRRFRPVEAMTHV
jgi:ABC-type lipoprotein release transport system permease subunit